jgi:hypothetical protein
MVQQPPIQTPYFPQQPQNGQPGNYVNTVPMVQSLYTDYGPQGVRREVPNNYGQGEIVQSVVINGQGNNANSQFRGGNLNLQQID